MALRYQGSGNRLSITQGISGKPNVHFSVLEKALRDTNPFRTGRVPRDFHLVILILQGRNINIQDFTGIVQVYIASL